MKTGGRSWGAGSNLQKILDTTEIPLKRNYILFDLDIAVSIPAWIVEHGRKVYWALSCDKRQFKEIKGIRNRCLASGFG